MAGLTDLTSQVKPTPVGLTDGQTFICAVPNGSPVIELHNESPLRIYVGVQNGSFSQQVIIPPTCVLHDCDLIEQLGATENGIIMTLRAEAMLGGTALLDFVSNQLKVFCKQFPAGPMSITSLVRNVGGNVVVSQQLLGVAQTLPLSEKDMSGVPTLVPPAGASQSIGLAANDGSGVPQLAFEIVGGVFPVVQLTNAELLILTQAPNPVTSMSMQFGIMNSYNSEPTQGGGVPSLVKLTENTPITVTTLQTIAQYFTPNDGSKHTVRVSATAIIINAVSGNACTLQVTYTDTAGNARTQFLPFLAPTGVAFVFMNASASIANNTYAGVPLTLDCNPGTAVTISYRDPTNTPNDHVTGVIERLS